MTLRELTAILGDGSFVLCIGKRRVDRNLYGLNEAERWLEAGGENRVGWWVKAPYAVIDIDVPEDVERGSSRDIASRISDYLCRQTMVFRSRHGIHAIFNTSGLTAVDGQVYNVTTQKVKHPCAMGTLVDTRLAGKGYIILPYGDEHRSILSSLPPYHDGRVLFPLRGLGANSERYIVEGMGTGGRNNALLQHIMRLKQSGVDDGIINQAVGIINNFMFEAPLPNSEVIRILESIRDNGYIPEPGTIGDRLRSGRGNVGIGGRATGRTHTDSDGEAISSDVYTYSDRGQVNGISHVKVVEILLNSEQIICIKGNAYVYSDGAYREQTEYIKDRIKVVIADERWQKAAEIDAVFRLLCQDVRIVKTDDDLNLNRHRIIFANGYFDVHERRFIAGHDNLIGDYPTVCIPWNYNGAFGSDMESLRHTQFWDFIRKTRLAPDDISMLFDFMCCCLSRNNSWKSMLMLEGGGNTGKSTLIKFICSIVGIENTSALSIQTLGQRFYASAIKDKLINACADNETEALKSIRALKEVTGDDRILFERKGKDAYDFKSFAKLIFSFNQLPLQLEEKTDAFYNRLRILRMNNKIALTQTYVDTLLEREQIEAVIPFLVNRLVDLREIKPSRRSVEATEKLRRESDNVFAFVSHACTRENVVNGDEIAASVDFEGVYTRYCSWCTGWDRTPYKRNFFARSLEAMGIGIDYGARTITGLRLN